MLELDYRRLARRSSVLLALLAISLSGQQFELTAQEVVPMQTSESRASLENTAARDSPKATTPLQSRFSVTNNTEAWSRLPLQLPELPSWALTLVEPLPKATAALLQLDHLHRAQNPLGAVLSGKLRWAAADAIDCEYARNYAWADLQRAGLSDKELQSFTADTANLSEADRVVSDFARRMTLAANQVTDEEMATLLEMFGPENVVAMVHTLAFANFQYRLFLGLGVQVEPTGPLPPIQLRPDAEAQKSITAPERVIPEGRPAASTTAASTASVGWNQRDPISLELSLDKQKNRSSRIPLPPLDRLDGLSTARKEHAQKVVWSRISYGYQQKLTQSWFDMLQTFYQEAQMDRVFSNSVFWVVTRSNECFY
ncbi:MAG: hypothetical protein NXI32_24290 [bacterium]|nr:hypothetical protein [bacterium]